MASQGAITVAEDAELRGSYQTSIEGEIPGDDFGTLTGRGRGRGRRRTPRRPRTPATPPATAMPSGYSSAPAASAPSAPRTSRRKTGASSTSPRSCASPSPPAARSPCPSAGSPSTACPSAGPCASTGPPLRSATPTTTGVERGDGREAFWTELGRVPAAGDTDAVSDYDFLDPAPGSRAGGLLPPPAGRPRRAHTTTPRSSPSPSSATRPPSPWPPTPSPTAVCAWPACAKTPPPPCASSDPTAREVLRRTIDATGSAAFELPAGLPPSVLHDGSLLRRRRPRRRSICRGAPLTPRPSPGQLLQSQTVSP